ncbi:MAG: hypothetical protein LVQ96_08800 [Thermoplasmatales archaeon]|nr:hypothetical protein [Thermoplasmatales archaeon]
MPRKPAESLCKICGANATVKVNYATGSGGTVYLYEIYTHKNGTVHYFRPGKVLQKRDAFSDFEEMLRTKMKDGEYRFKDIKKLFESFRGSSASNTMVQRYIEKGMRAKLIRKSVEDGMKVVKIQETSVSYHISDSAVAMSILLKFLNEGESLLNRIPINIPTGIIDTISELNIESFDKFGKISEGNVEIAFSFTGQTGIGVGLRRSLGPSESDFLFVTSRFTFSEHSLKFALPLDTGSLRIHITKEWEKPVHVRKRLLDGIKETNPDSVRKGFLSDGLSFAEVEFGKSSKGEAVVVSW